MPFSHWYELPRPPKLMGSTLLERRGSGVLRQPVDEYNTVELISMPAHPAGVGIQSGPSGRVERGRGVRPRPRAHGVREQRRGHASPRPRPGPGDGGGDRVREVDVDLRCRPRRQCPIVQRHPDPGVWALREVLGQIDPGFLDRLVQLELLRHRRDRRAELVRENIELGRGHDLVDVDHTLRGDIRSQSVQRVIDAAVPLEASAPCSATVTMFSCGTPAASANTPRSGYGPISTFPLAENVFVPKVISVPSSFW